MSSIHLLRIISLWVLCVKPSSHIPQLTCQKQGSIRLFTDNVNSHNVNIQHSNAHIWIRRTLTSKIYELCDLNSWKSWFPGADLKRASTRPQIKDLSCIFTATHCFQLFFGLLTRTSQSFRWWYQFSHLVSKIYICKLCIKNN